MPFFFFHLSTPVGMEPDDIGVDCAGLEAACLEAQRAIPEMAASLLRAGTNPMLCQYEICDGRGQLQRVVRFEELAWRRPVSG